MIRDHRPSKRLPGIGRFAVRLTCHALSVEDLLVLSEILVLMFGGREKVMLNGPKAGSSVEKSNPRDQKDRGKYILNRAGVSTKWKSQKK